MSTNISHTTIKTDGKENTYAMKFSGAPIGSAEKAKIDVKVGDKTKKVDGFKFTPGAGFEKIGSLEGATMKDLKEKLEKATAAAGIEVPKAEAKPKAAGLATESVKTEAALAGTKTDGDVDL